MKSDLVKIKFFFPKISAGTKNKKELIRLIMKAMRKDRIIKYTGYLRKKDLRKGLIQHMGKEDISRYKPLSAKQKQIIKKTIFATTQKCNKKLPLPTKNFIFIFPWFPPKRDKALRGSFGFAVSNCVLHIFLSPQVFTLDSLSDTIVHEINHTISFYYHPDRYDRWSLLDSIINEGLAENFREDVLGKKSAPWAIALTKKEAFGTLKSIHSFLSSRDLHTYQNIMFGNKKYKRWTGYSIGYWMVKEFRKKHKNFTWKEIMKTNPESIFKKS